LRFKYILIACFLILLLIPGSAFSQYFGKNKVQYKNFKWNYIQSEHFDVYYSRGGEYLAAFAADEAEAAYNELKEDLRYELGERVPIIIYNSHNDFQQSNVISQYLYEGIVGVTESFKNRVVVPYEGVYSNFRHTIHHELVHALVNDMLYGNSLPSLISGQIRIQLPMWLSEGLAEYEAGGWDTNADMIIRDATIAGLLGGVSPYQGGQSILNFIAEKYGEEKIGEIIGKIKLTKDVEKGIRSSIGLDLKELEKQWSLHLKRKYWPDIADRKQPDEFAKKLSDHKQLRNYFNTSPAISPNGDKIAFLTDRNGYADVYLMSAIDGKVIKKLVSGQKSSDFEELHWLAPGISWSPDGKKITLAAKSGNQDALHIITIKNSENEKYTFDLDGVFDPDWSPDGDKIAFIGTKHGKADIYYVELSTGELHKVTDDYFSDMHPAWSPDGKTIAFASDRRNYTDPDLIDDEIRIQNLDYSQTDIYLVNIDGSNIRRLTFTEYDEGSPVWSEEGNKIAYTSESNGISNIFMIDVSTREFFPITNIITGCFQLSWSKDGSKLVFTSYYEGGYDIYMIKNPGKFKPGDIQLKNTVYFTKLEEQRNKEKTDVSASLAYLNDNTTQKRDYSKYIFDEEARKFAVSSFEESQEEKDIALEPSEYKTETGEYKKNRYKLNFSPDIVYGAAAYDTYFGAQGSSVIQISDIMGDHTIIITTDLYMDLKNSNYGIYYYNLPHLTDFGIGVYHQAGFFSTYEIVPTSYGYGYQPLTMRLRQFGVEALASRPFSRFSRIDLGLSLSFYTQEWLDDYYADYNFNLRSFRPKIEWVTDTIYWGYPGGPMDGRATRLSLTYSPSFLNSLSSSYSQEKPGYVTVTTDLRKYMKFKKDYSFAMRFTAGFSEGKQRTEGFFLGGIDNWLNRKWNGDLRTGIYDIFFSHWIWPLRGSNYYELIGSRYFLTNFELRFPFLRYLSMGFPLPLTLANLRGVLFTDIGGAWFKDDFKATTVNKYGERVFQDMRIGYGIGTRVYLGGYFLMRFDIAWDYNLVGSSKPKYYISMGTDW